MVNLDYFNNNLRLTLAIEKVRSFTLGLTLAKLSSCELQTIVAS
jgi:hypothetical protein